MLRMQCHCRAGGKSLSADLYIGKSLNRAGSQKIDSWLLVRFARVALLQEPREPLEEPRNLLSRIS